MIYNENHEITSIRKWNHVIIMVKRGTRTVWSAIREGLGWFWTDGWFHGDSW